MRTATRSSRAATRPTTTASSRTPRSTTRARRRRGPRSTGTGCSAPPARSTRRPQRRSRRRTTSSSARPTRSASRRTTSPNTIGILQNLGRFPQLTDRLQQGLLNELLLGRLMDNPSGFLTNAAFHVSGVDTTSPAVIDTSKLYYNGNSQGGILGGALTAVSPDFTRASLGVPAMNYRCCCRAPSTTRPTGDPATPPTRTRCHGPCAGPDPDALGPVGAERLRAPDDRQPAPEHPAAPGVDERRASATTR